MKKRITYAKPSITEVEKEYMKAAMEMSWGEQFSYFLDKFENMFKSWLGVKYAMPTSSCTGALHIGLDALGIKPGDEVILPESTWIATAAAVTYLGAKPVFVDILPDTWCIDPRKVDKAITEKTKAIIAVHLYGNLADAEDLQQFGIPVIEDAAEAIGTVDIYGNRSGSIGDFGVFSFHGTKTITTGEGGMFVTNDKNLYNRAITLSNHGRTGKKQFWFDRIGYKYKMTPIQAAIGCGQMERIAEIIARKREIFKYYEHFLEDLPLRMNPERGKNGYWMPTIVTHKVTREEMQAAFEKDNIDARVFFYPLSSMPMFETNQGNIHAYNIPKRAMNLPSFHDMTNEEQDRVIDCVRGLWKST
jgi:perosamine synthetase